MNSEEVSLPLIHKHPMMPSNDMRKGGCCGRFEAISDGYFCKKCDFFVHKKCCNESSESIQHPSHPDHTLRLVSKSGYICNLCGMRIRDLFYNCEICNFDIDLCCANYQPPEVIEISETHHHKLTLFKEVPKLKEGPLFRQLARLKEDMTNMTTPLEELLNMYEHMIKFGEHPNLSLLPKFDCAAKCSNDEFGFPYKCHECDSVFHVDCVWHPPKVKHPSEVNYSYHSLHPLKLHTKGQLPDYSDGICSLCESKIDDRLFYHCSLCNFTLDMRCVLYPPRQSILHLKAHDHQLTLLPRRDSFVCDACSLKGDRSRYTCFQCGFTIHQDCLNLPRLININRHDHRVSRTSVLGVVNSICGVCHKKVDWTYGGFSCPKCPGYVIHSKCATRKDVWNGKELEGIPEETEDLEPYVVINGNTIQHFSHKEHHLRLHVNDVLCDDNKRCMACTHPICLQSFYRCIDCDFIPHQNCAGFLKMKRHFLHNDRLTLVTNDADFFFCDACGIMCNGFRYQDRGVKLDVRCASISEPFFHPSHHDHPLYQNFTSKGEEKSLVFRAKKNKGEKKRCNGCKYVFSYRSVLCCIEGDCGFVLCFRCATLPLVVKHRVDDYPLSLCYGDGEKASGTYWCDICEEETVPNKWFYTCKDQRASLHTQCVLGSFSNLMPRSTIRRRTTNYEVVLNNSVSRPICGKCNLHCIYPIILKHLEKDEYICSYYCWG